MASRASAIARAPYRAPSSRAAGAGSATTARCTSGRLARVRAWAAPSRPAPRSAMPSRPGAITAPSRGRRPATRPRPGSPARPRPRRPCCDTTQQWFGTTLTTSPTDGRSRQRDRSTVPCSSESAVIGGVGVLEDVPVARHPVLVRGEDLGAAVEDRPAVGGAADHGRAHAHRALVPRRRPRADHHRVVVDAGARPVLGQHRELVARVRSAGVPPPETIGTGMPARLKSSSARSK